jgi:hypothetical protein
MNFDFSVTFFRPHRGCWPADERGVWGGSGWGLAKKFLAIGPCSPETSVQGRHVSPWPKIILLAPGPNRNFASFIRRRASAGRVIGITEMLEFKGRQMANGCVVKRIEEYSEALLNAIGRQHHSGGLICE